MSGWVSCSASAWAMPGRRRVCRRETVGCRSIGTPCCDGSVVVLRPTDVVVVWQFGGIAGGGRLAIEARVEDGLDAAVAAGAVRDGAGAGGLQPLRADLAAEPQHAHGGTEALFGMAPTAEHLLHGGRGLWADRAGPAQQPIRVPLGLVAMVRGHVRGDRGVPARHR